MAEKRRGLGKGLGALIPTAPTQGRPIDVFFADRGDGGGQTVEGPPAHGNGVVDAAVPATITTLEPTRSNGHGTSGDAPNGNGAASKGAAAGDGGVVAGQGPASGTIVTPEPETALEAPEAGLPATPAPGALAPAGEAPAAQRASADEAPAADAAPALDRAPGTGTPLGNDDGGLVPVPGATFADIPLDDIVANRRQPRQVFDEDELEELAASIREVGVLQPIVVRALPDGDDARFELIMGERRWRASRLAGNATVPAIIRETVDGDLLRDALLENLHRAQLNPLEEAAAYSQLLEDFGCTHEELASRIARSRPQISNTLRLLKLPPLVQRRVAAGVLSAGHARALLGLSDGAAMERLAQRIVAEGLSVRTTEEIIALGDEPTRPEMRRRLRGGAHDAELHDLAGRLADQLDTRVTVAMGQRKGKIAIEFASVEDLNRIVQILAPADHGVRAEMAV